MGRVNVYISVHLKLFCFLRSSERTDPLFRGCFDISNVSATFLVLNRWPLIFSLAKTVDFVREEIVLISVHLSYFSVHSILYFRTRSSLASRKWTTLQKEEMCNTIRCEASQYEDKNSLLSEKKGLKCWYGQTTPDRRHSQAAVLNTEAGMKGRCLTSHSGPENPL